MEKIETVKVPKKAAVNISELIKKSSTSTKSLEAWVEFKSGIEFQICFVPRAVFKKMADSCTVFKLNPKTQVREATPDTDRLMAQFAARAVKGWRNLTPRTLVTILPFELDQVAPENLDDEIEFSQELLKQIMDLAYDFDRFLQEICMDPQYFNAAHGEELKN